MSEEFKNAGCSASDCSSCCESCGSGQNQIPNTISLTLDDNTEVECAILTIFPVKEKEYIALLPLDENGQNQDGEVYLYVFSRTEQGDPMLANIESDEEYASAAEESLLYKNSGKWFYRYVPLFLSGSGGDVFLVVLSV